MIIFRVLAIYVTLCMAAGCNSGGYTTENPDEFCIRLLGAGHQEARDWLKSGTRNTLGVIQTQADSLEFIEQVYALGAPHVFAVEIARHPDGMENTRTLVVELPADPQERPGVIEWAAKIAHGEGFDAYSDVGQKYVFVMLD